MYPPTRSCHYLGRSHLQNYWKDHYGYPVFEVYRKHPAVKKQGGKKIRSERTRSWQSVFSYSAIRRINVSNFCVVSGSGIYGYDNQVSLLSHPAAKKTGNRIQFSLLFMCCFN